jgi:hypothetical protein
VLNSVLTVVIVIIAVALGDIVFVWLQDVDEAHEQRKPAAERERARQLERRALGLFIGGVVCCVAADAWLRSNVPYWLAMGLLALAFGHLLMASRHTTVFRTVTAFLLVVGGGAVLLWGLAPLSSPSESTPSPVPLERLVGVASSAVLFAAAVWLARGRRPLL